MYGLPTHTRWYNPGCSQELGLPSVSTPITHRHYNQEHSNLCYKGNISSYMKQIQKYYITVSIQTYISHYNKGKPPLMNTENESSTRPITTALQAAEPNKQHEKFNSHMANSIVAIRLLMLRYWKSKIWVRWRCLNNRHCSVQIKGAYCWANVK